MPRRSALDIARELRRAIEAGEYRQFERLPPSRDLAERMGVARNTLREALFRLQREGLVQTKQGSGTIVKATHMGSVPNAVEDATPLELIDARFALEPHICRLCVLHGRREDLETLDHLCQRMENAVGDPGAFAEADTAFHSALAESTRNRILILLIAQINMVRSLDEWTRMRHLTLNVQMIQEYNRQHREILNAIRAREPERAAMKMKDHLQSARLSLMRAAEA